MPFEFNAKLWNIGREIEDEALPKLNQYFDCELKRDDTDIWDILDFRDDEKKIIVEVKGRLIPSTQYKETIITASKIMAGFQAIDQDYKVYFLFVFTDKSMIIELKGDSSFQVRFTGTNCIKHYCIPISELKDFDPEEINNLQE
jgi:hypothetical protein|tara:strand:- start:5146 stop:5577 length:432 start_codon:yes stop_codon:yes gene_type:complete